MFNGPEIWIIILLVVVLFGGKRLPNIARNLGKAQSELKKALLRVLPRRKRRNSKNRQQIIRSFNRDDFHFRPEHITQ